MLKKKVMLQLEVYEYIRVRINILQSKHYVYLLTSYIANKPPAIARTKPYIADVQEL